MLISNCVLILARHLRKMLSQGQRLFRLFRMTQAHSVVDISDAQQQAPTGTSRRQNDTLVDRPTAGIRWRPLRQSPRKQVINIAELPPSVPPLRQQQPKPPKRRQQRNPHQNTAVNIQQQVDLGELLQRLSAAEAERDRLSDLVARAEQPPSRTTEVDDLKNNVDGTVTYGGVDHAVQS